MYGGGHASGKIGPLEAEVKARITVSSKEGVSAAVEAKGAVGPVGGAVKIDKTGSTQFWSHKSNMIQK